MQLSNVVVSLRRYWMVITALVLLGAGTGAVFQLAQSAAYTSTVRIYVANDFADSVPVSQTTNLAVQRMQSYVLLVGSTQLAERVVTRADIDASPRQVAGNLQASFDRDTVLMTVTARSSSAEVAEAVVTEVPDSMTDLVNSLSATAPSSRGAPTEFTTFDGPVTARTRSLPRIAVSVLFGAVLGLGLGTAVAALLAGRRTGLGSPEELRDATGRPVVGIIPVSLSTDPAADPAVEDSPRWDAYRRLAFNLRILSPEQHYVVVVTGAAEGAGAATTAAGLASALTASGEEVLLVTITGDGTGASAPDIMRSDVTRSDVMRSDTTVPNAGAPNAEATTVELPVSRARAGRAPASEVPTRNAPVRKVPMSRAPVSEAPNCPDRVTLREDELGTRHDTDTALTSYRTRYDVTVIDAPPVLSGLVTTALSAHADVVLIVADQRGMAREDVVAAADALYAVGGASVGCVLNDVERSSVPESKLRAGLVLGTPQPDFAVADR